MQQPSPLYKRYRFPGEVISHAVWLPYRFLLSSRDVEGLLAERGAAGAMRRSAAGLGGSDSRSLTGCAGAARDPLTVAPRRGPVEDQRAQALALAGGGSGRDRAGPPGPARCDQEAAEALLRRLVVGQGYRPRTPVVVTDKRASYPPRYGGCSKAWSTAGTRASTTGRRTPTGRPADENGCLALQIAGARAAVPGALHAVGHHFRPPRHLLPPSSTARPHRALPAVAGGARLQRRPEPASVITSQRHRTSTAPRYPPTCQSPEALSSSRPARLLAVDAEPAPAPAARPRRFRSPLFASAADAVAEVGDAALARDPDPLQLALLDAEVLEQPPPVAHQDRHEADSISSRSPAVRARWAMAAPWTSTFFSPAPPWPPAPRPRGRARSAPPASRRPRRAPGSAEDVDGHAVVVVAAPAARGLEGPPPGDDGPRRHELLETWRFTPRSRGTAASWSSPRQEDPLVQPAPPVAETVVRASLGPR